MQYFYIFLILLLLFILIKISFNRNLEKNLKSSWGKFPIFDEDDKFDEKKIYSGYKALADFYDRKNLLDDITWNDLDMFRIFKQISISKSSIGEESLYYRLRDLETKEVDIRKMEQLIDFFDSKQKERIKAQKYFFRIGKLKDNSIFEFVKNFKADSNFILLHIIMGLIPLISFILIFFKILQISIIALIFSTSINLLYFERKKITLSGDFELISYLSYAIKRGKKFSRLDIPTRDKLRNQQKKLWKFKYLSFIGNPNSGSIEGLLLYYLSILFMLPLISYSILSIEIKKNRQDIFDYLMELGLLEDSISILNYRKSLKAYCHPEFSEKVEVKAEELYHPLLKKPVPNDVNWNQLCLVTGSNASGKSTYVKSIALNIILGQTINTCCANSIVLKAGMVYTSMAIKDNLIDGDSYFIAEIKSLKRLVDNVEKDNFAYYFIDEILKGTNTIERIGASSSIIGYLIEKKQMAFIATHDIELTRMFGSRVNNIHFKESIRDKNIEFDYKVHEGPSITRNAIKLLSVMNFPENIVLEANETVENFEKEAKWEYKKK